MMTLDAISVGRPQEAQWQGKTFQTSIFKTPVSGPVKVFFNNLEGDQQSDLKVHGGPTRAIYGYATEYYDFWKKELGLEKLDSGKLPWGFFGENLTISGGLFEDQLHVGDRFAIGDVELEVMQPRMPCFKLAMKVNDKGFIKKFADARKVGSYFGVIKEGTIEAGQSLTPTFVSENSITIDEIVELYFFDKDNKSLINKALQTERLTDSWKEYLQKRLDKQE
ncbi:MAG TPA: MOSC domain-containing protein [Microscillaceae bacterium]|nr:MOSC domain-containing protein [Microscillaceae bacterium]